MNSLLSASRKLSIILLLSCTHSVSLAYGQSAGDLLLPNASTNAPKAQPYGPQSLSPSYSAALSFSEFNNPPLMVAVRDRKFTIIDPMKGRFRLYLSNLLEQLSELRFIDPQCALFVNSDVRQRIGLLVLSSDLGLKKPAYDEYARGSERGEQIVTGVVAMALQGAALVDAMRMAATDDALRLSQPPYQCSNPTVLQWVRNAVEYALTPDPVTTRPDGSKLTEPPVGGLHKREVVPLYGGPIGGLRQVAPANLEHYRQLDGRLRKRTDYNFLACTYSGKMSNGKIGYSTYHFWFERVPPEAAEIIKLAPDTELKWMGTEVVSECPANEDAAVALRQRLANYTPNAKDPTRRR